MFFFFSQRRDLAHASTTATHLHIAHVFFFFFVHAAHVCACLQVLENPPSCIFNALVCLYMFRPFLNLFCTLLFYLLSECHASLKKKIVVCTAVLITAMCHNLVTCLFHPTLVKKKKSAFCLLTTNICWNKRMCAKIGCMEII